VLLILKNNEKLCAISTENLQAFRTTCFWLADGKVQIRSTGYQYSESMEIERLHWPIYKLSLEDKIVIKFADDDKTRFTDIVDKSKLSSKTTMERIKDIEIKFAKMGIVDRPKCLVPPDICNDLFFSFKKNNSLGEKISMKGIIQLQLAVKWKTPAQNWTYSITARYRGERYIAPICGELDMGDQLITFTS